jgi:hypothetical protein
MGIQRNVRRTEIGQNRVRYRVIVQGEECPQGTHEAIIHQALFLNWLGDNQSLLECGYSRFQKLTIQHNGTAWEAVAEAEVDEATE